MSLAKKYTPSKPSGFKKSKPVVKTKPATSSDDGDDQGLFAMIYSAPGGGKSSWAAEFPGVRFLIDKQEMGIKNLVKFKRVKKPEHGIIVIDDWSDLMANVENVPDEVETLAIDSLTVFQEMAFVEQFNNSKTYDNDWAKFKAYSAGPNAAASNYWRPFMGALNDVVNRGKNVILIAHATTRESTNVYGANFQKIVPFLANPIWSQTALTVQTILYLGLDIVVEKVGNQNKANENSGSRVMKTSLNVYCEAKNWMGLPEEINMGSSSKEGYEAFMDAYKACGG